MQIKNLYKLILTSIFLFPFCNIFSQSIFYNKVYHDQIKTVQVFRMGWELSHPIINLNNNEKLTVRFDKLDNETGNYYYTIFQCKSDWSMSELVQQDYLEGFYENPITNYKFSSNTTINYINYQFTFPNKDFKITKSGNYALVVYEDFDQEKVVFTKRFCVYEPLVDIIAKYKRPILAAEFNKGQEIDVSIIHKGLEIFNPQEEIKLVILQNFDWNTKIDLLKPTFIKSDELIYDYNEENVFPGLSEFRYLDIKSLRYQSEYIQSISYDYHYNHVILVPGNDRHFGEYFYNEDLNGKYLIEVQEYPDPQYEADYVIVHFNLPYNIPVVDGNIHVYGGLTDWNISNKSKMKYNFENKSYEAGLLLKQGYYNYYYVLEDTIRNILDMSYIEGSHYETENDYYVLVYYHPYHLRYDRLIGIQLVNSVRKMGNK